jgi:uncharacterized protein (TIGR03435 family)
VAYETQPYEDVVAANQDVSDQLEVEYVFNALPPGAASMATRAEAAAMARRLLAERFGLKLRVETESANATVLRMIKPGVFERGLRPAPEGCEPLPRGAVAEDARFDEAYQRSCALTSFGGRIRGTVTLDEFARLLSFGLQRPVLNGTDLEGLFAIDVAAAKATWFTVWPTRESDGPSLLDALRDQMGLTTRTELQPIRRLVVEHVGPLLEN